jgi:hypothetical protein
MIQPAAPAGSSSALLNMYETLPLRDNLTFSGESRCSGISKHEQPEALTNRLLELEEEITVNLQDQLGMVAVPSGPYTEVVAEAHPRAADAEEGYARESS